MTAESHTSSLPRRVIAALVLAPLVLAVVWRGGPALWLLAEVVACVGLYEWHLALRHRGVVVAKEVAFPILVFLLAVTQWIPAESRGFAREAALAILVIGSLVFYIVEKPPSADRSLWPHASLCVAGSVFGVLYLSLLEYGLRLRALPDGGGQRLLVLLLALTWVTDIGAFFVGRALGGRKLAPQLSPGKTVAGAIGGLVACLVTSLLMAPWLHGTLRASQLAACGILLGVTGQLGDLAASLLKRDLEVKDFGALIPGHGGVLDRCDSLLFNAPALYYFVVLATQWR